MKGPIEAYKGVTWWRTSEFGDRFEAGQTYVTEDGILLRRAGFHACINPWHVLDYYTPYESRFLKVQIDGQMDSCDHMVAGTQMTVLRELTDREVIEQLIAQHDYRLESFDAVLSDQPHDCIWGERHGLVVQSSGTNVFIRVHSDSFYGLSTGDKASIYVDPMSMNGLILSYGDDATIDCGGSMRIFVGGKRSVVKLTGSNHLLHLAAGTVLEWNGRTWVAGTDFPADCYCLTEDGKVSPLTDDAAPVKDEIIIR